MTAARWWWCTVPAPAAIAVACVHGSAEELSALAHALTGADVPDLGHVAWRRLHSRAGSEPPFDDGVLARVDQRTLLIMPHGGAQIRALLVQALERCGVFSAPADAANVQAIYPEAADQLEALVLHTLAYAASPCAVELLLAQPARWRAALAGVETRVGPAAPTFVGARDAALNRLIVPARVVVTGAANAGKSTLMNTLAGRAVAVAHDQPGTTRDAVAVRLNLDGIVVDWFDTPGVRTHTDDVEADAAALATTMLQSADLVVLLSAPGLGWHSLTNTGCSAPTLKVLNKCDTTQANTCAERADAALEISAARGDGLSTLVQQVKEMLIPRAYLDSTEPWWFSSHLINLSTP
jgi:small GTP-binding protein